MTHDLKFLNAFNSIPGVGPATLRILKIRFGTFREAWLSGEETLRAALNDEKTALTILWKKPSINPDKEMERLVKEGISIVTDQDPIYPALLKEIPCPPLALYCKGNPAILRDTRTNTDGLAFSGDTKRHEEKRNENICVGVVGTRKCTQYGLEAAESITYELAAAGIIIVSGLASGIDSRAHEAALDARGKTVAVLGTGLDANSIFPPQNQGLARRIIESGGAVISEYAPGTPGFKEHFPQRNRIISGLSRGVLVIEAPEKSGALITARFALEQNREVFAVPGPIFSLHSRGSHKLIQEGAKLVTEAKDILEELGIEYTKSTGGTLFENATETEKKILKIVTEPLSIDVIKARTGLETPAIVASLGMLELKGAVRNLGGDTYQRISNS